MSVAPKAAGGLRSGETPSGDDSKYYIYSSDSGKASDANTKVLSADIANLDDFLSFLPDAGITLSELPSSTVSELDESDQWKIWMANWDAGCDLSITVDDSKNMNIQLFELHLTTPWDLVFSSAADVLLFSFGTSAIGIPCPGIESDGSPLYFGLNPSKSKTISTSIKELFTFCNLSDTAQLIPGPVGDLKATLDPTKGSEKRNAFWFTPEDEFGTVTRLQFEIDNAEKVQDILGSQLNGLKFTGVNLICKKAIVLAKTADGQEIQTTGGITFEVTCTITPSGGKSVGLILALEVFEQEIDLTFVVKDPSDGDAFTSIIDWLFDLLPEGGGVKDIQKTLEKDDIFKDYIHLRRLRVALDSGKTKIMSVTVEIEVSGKFGQGDTTQRAPFLVTYNWNANAGALGSISGQFWNFYNSSTDRLLDPRYEDFSMILPVTPSPVKVLDLATLIPGANKIIDIPDTVPTEISRAAIYLSQDMFAIGASIESKAHAGGDNPGMVPKIDLGQISLNAWFTWGASKNFTLEIGFTTLLVPSDNSKNQDAAYLMGDVKYDSSKGWRMEAELASLHASTLCEFFDEESANHVLPLLDSLSIAQVHLLYEYEKGVSRQAAGSSLDFTGDILVAELELYLTFHFDNVNGWKFTADLKATNDKTTIGDILASILGDDDLDLPPFLADTSFNGKDSGNTIHLEIQKSTKPDTPGAGFHFLTNIVFNPIEVVFAQFHGMDWPASTPSKRLVKVGLMALPSIEVPLIGDLTQPFDEMYLLWVQDAANLPKTKQSQPGLMENEIDDINTSLGNYPLLYSNKSQTPQKTDVVITSGAHLCVVLKDQNNKRNLVLDYAFKKSQPQSQPKKQLSGVGESRSLRLEEEKKPDSDGSSSSAPFKKKAGPLSISNLGLKYSDKKLQVILTATMELGPIGLSLIGFSIDVDLAILKKPDIHDLSFSLEGLSVAFEKPPLTIAGLIRHGKDPNMEYYAGGLIIGWVPYQLQAAGFYGRVKPENADEFVSVFVFARLDGPLVELEFAEISGITGGFGYNSNVKLPTPDQIVNFPFIKQSGNEETETAMDTLKRLTDPGKGGWFNPLPGTYWAAVGMKVDAFQLIAIDAVAVVQFGEAIKLGIFAVASVDIPNPKSPEKFAHAELGIAVVVDFAYGVLKAEAQLSPNSYILHPSCHLTGGFALYYWFEAPHADLSKIGDFVFSMGGYHPAYELLDGYPNPPRLGISWSLGGGLSITGQAYFAITPKACMGGGRLHAALHAGPLEAWFDAFANFLINYKPFHFLAEVGVDVGVKFNVDVWFIHIHISVDVGADLTMWGPPLAGRVHISLKVVKFDINFGDAGKNVDPIALLEFYQLVLQADKSSKLQVETQALATHRVTEVEENEDKQPIDMPKNEGHTFLAESGLMNDTEKGARKQNQDWLVRGGSFVFIIGCKMAITRADLMDGKKSIGNVTYNQTVYARPMKLTVQTKELESTLEVSLTRKDGKVIMGWKMEKVVKSLPTALWGEYNPYADPLKSGNNIQDLLSTAGGTIDLLAGVRLTAPPPRMSTDPYPVFDIADAELQTLFADKPFPKSEDCNTDWEPVEALQANDQFRTVQEKWTKPDWDEETGSVQEEFVGTWATALGWDAGLSQWARIPEWVGKQFNKLYAEAPLMTK